MTWREFSLRLEGFKRKEKAEWAKSRLIAYQVYLNTNIKGKHVDIEKFMPIYGSQNKISKTQQSALREAQLLAIEQLKLKKNGR